MSESFFAFGNLWILPFWLCMILAPASGWTRRLLGGPLAFLVPAALYAVLIAPHLGEVLPLLARPELSRIQALLGTPLGASLGWLHFLAFDLFIGRWIWQQDELPGWLLRPVLALTLMFGPLGLLTFFGLRRFPWTRTPLLALSATMPFLAALCLLGLALDPRQITGLPAWIKPLKFALSVWIYTLTLEAVLGTLEPHPWLTRIRGWTAACLTGEMVVIVGQAARGTTSHFNRETPLDGLLFALMGLGILVVWGAAIATAWLLRRQPTELGLALAWGAAISVVGMGLAWPMTVWGQHTVGAPDGGPGLPLLGWSTLHGDLRVPHFVGLHSLQWMGLVWWLQRGAGNLRARLHLAGVGYLGLVILLTRQALAGLSVVSPDLALVGWCLLLAGGQVFLNRVASGGGKERPEEG